MTLIEVVRAYPYQWIGIVYVLVAATALSWYVRREAAALVCYVAAAVVFFAPLLTALHP